MGEAQQLAEKIQNLDDDVFLKALDEAALSDQERFNQGVRAYHSHPYCRSLEDPACVWQDGNSRLLDYGQAATKDAPAVILVPSLINRATILDLRKDASLARTLAEKGLHPYLLDWGEPTGCDTALSLDEYILTRLDQCVDFVAETTKSKPALAGYCMGGTMVLGYASHHQEKLSAIALLATPWNFHTYEKDLATALNSARATLEATMSGLGHLPIDIIQGLFTLMDPFQVIRKYQAFAEQNLRTKAAQRFVSIEDWLNDGVILSAAVARTCLFDWFIDNAPHKGTWKVGDKTVTLCEITLPSLVVIAKNDRIVPPESSLSLGNQLPSAKVLELSAGHVGMVAGRRARSGLYSPLAQWLTRIVTKRSY